MQKEAFPVRLFLVYVFFYAGQAVYNTYLNLYLSSAGLTNTQIGMIVSVSTVFILVAQVLWGVLSDRAKYKNTILQLLYIACAGIILLYYAGTSFIYLLALVTVFSIFFNPIIPLQDNIMLESLEHSRWDYGQVRMGGTLGYCFTVLLIGFLLNDDYGHIFWITGLGLLMCFLISLRLPRIRGHRQEGAKTPYRQLLKNKPLLTIICFNLIFYLGLSFYYSFYPIYFTSIGGNSGLIGTMMFVSAIAEVPVLFVINRVVKKIGTGRVLIIAGLCTSVRWVLLFLLKNPALIIAANALHGIGYTGFSYCIITYINQTVPKDLRATSQTLNAVISSIFSRVIFGYLGGVLSSLLGTEVIMLLCGLLMLAATGLFALWLSRNRTVLNTA